MIFLIVLLLFFSLTDYLWFTIPNIVIIPALVIAGIITGNWLWMAVAGLVGALLYNRKVWCGGDVKLLALVGAFMAWQAIVVVVCTIALIKAYRRGYSRQGKKLPCAPFIAISCGVVMLMGRLINVYIQ